MKEYLLLIRTEGDYCAEMPAEQYKKHLTDVSNYISNLTQQGRFKGAQPLHLEGTMLHGSKGVFKDGPFIESKEVIIGYFLILAKDLDDAREIAKAHPMFKENVDAKIEIRLVKHEEGIN